MSELRAALARFQQVYSKTSVSGVTAVTLNRSNRLAVTEDASVGVTCVTSAAPVTPVTEAIFAVLPRNQLRLVEVTAITPVTPKKDITQIFRGTFSVLAAYRSALASFKLQRPSGVTRFRHEQACWAAEMFLNDMVRACR